MARFSGAQGKGALGALRKQRRREAEARNGTFTPDGVSRDRLDDLNDPLRDLDFDLDRDDL